MNYIITKDRQMVIDCDGTRVCPACYDDLAPGDYEICRECAAEANK